MIEALLNVVFLAPLIFGFPDLRVKWSSPKEEGVSVAIMDPDTLLDNCVKSGFEMRYRYEVQLCRKRTFWFSECKDKRIVYNALDFDPISESYKLTRDLWHDGIAPDSVVLQASDEAAEKMSNIDSLPLSFLGDGDKEFTSQPKLFIVVRAYSECRGEYNKTVADVSKFLTFGLLKISGFDSGSKTFEVRP